MKQERKNLERKLFKKSLERKNWIFEKILKVQFFRETRMGASEVDVGHPGLGPDGPTRIIRAFGLKPRPGWHETALGTIFKKIQFFHETRVGALDSLWKIAHRGLVKFIWGAKKLRKPEKTAFLKKNVPSVASCQLYSCQLYRVNIIVSTLGPPLIQMEAPIVALIALSASRQFYFTGSTNFLMWSSANL